MNEDLLVQMVADHWRSIQPDISNKELVEKFNEAKAAPEQFAAEAYKKEKGRMIDKRNLNVFGEALGIQMDPTKLKGISYIGNNNSDVIAAKAEYDKLSQESLLPEQYTDEQFRRAVKEEVTPWESIKQGFTSLLPGSSEYAAETTAAAEKRVREKHKAMVNARNKYESLRGSADGNILSIEDLYRDSKKDVEIQDMLTSSMSKATASVTPAKAFFDNLPGIGNEKNNLSELSVKMKEKADAYIEVLFENLQDKSKALASPEEKKLAQEMLSGNFDGYDQNAQYSEDFKKWTKSLNDFGDQKIEFNKIYAKTTGDKKSYDDIYRERVQEEQKKADENDGFFSLIGSWAGSLKESYKSLKRTIVDNVTESDEEELLNALDKSVKFTDKHLQVLNGYNLQKNIEKIQKIENTVRSSDWGSPIMMNSAIVNGHVLAVDDKHNFMYVVGPDGKTVAVPSIDQQKAIDDYIKNPSAYKVNFGWSATPFKSAINLIGETIAQLVPMIATGAVAAAAAPATGGTSAAAFMGTATMFAQQYGNYYEEELQRSGKANKAGQYAALMAGAESVAEVLGGQVEMKLSRALAGRSGRDIIMNAARETANKIAMAKNAANFSVMNEFVANMAKDVGQEYAEEFGTMIAQSGINAMFGNDSSISMNELVSTLVATPFATMAMSAIPSYQSAREEYKQSLMAAATNIEAFNENLALMVESGKISEDEAKLKYQMVDKLKNWYRSYNTWMKNDKISFTKKEAEKFESLVFDEVFSIKDEKAKDNTEKILALVEEARGRTYQNRPSEAPAPKIDITEPDPQASAIGAILNDEDPKDPNDPENPVPPTGGASVPVTPSVQSNGRPSKIGQNIDADGEWGYVEQGVSLSDAYQHTLHLNIDKSTGVKLPLDRLGVDHLLLMARPGKNRYEGNVELHFKSAEDAKKAYKVLSDAGIKSDKDMSGLIGKELENGIVYTQGHFMNRDVAANIIENARDNGDGTFTSTDMFSGNDFTFPAEKMIEYEQIAQGAQKAWDAPEVVPATDNGQVSTELVGTEQRSAAQPAGNNQSNTVPTVTRNRATTDTGIKAGVNTVLDVTAGSPDGLKVVYKNSLATLKVDEGGKVELSTPTKTIELGNIAEIGDVPVASFGVSMMPNANFNNNVIRIGDNLYVNRYSDPTAAINFEEGGVTVDLERIVTTGGYQGRKTTKSYEKVLLTGADAEIAASVIMEHALESNPVFAQDFEEFVSSSPSADAVKQEASQYDTGDTEAFDVTVRQDVMNYIIDNFQGPLETITAMAELFTLIAERMARTFPEKYPTAVDYFKAKMVGFSSPEITFEILNQFLDGAIESAGNDQVKAELQDIKQFLDDNRSVFVEPEQPATTTGAAGSEQQSGTANQGSQTVPKAVPGGNDVQVLGEDKRADIERRRQEELDELENELKSNGINLGVNDLKQTAEKIIDDIQSPFVKQVLKVLLNLISKTGATLEIVREGGIGYNPSKNRITIGLDTILDGFNRNREARSKGISNGFSIKYGKSEGTAVSYFATTLLHEIVHTFTSKQIDVFTGKSQGNLTDEERNILAHLQKIFELVKTNPLLKGEYGLYDLHELIAEVFSNETFADKLKNIKLPKELQYKSKSKNLFEGIIDLIADLITKAVKGFSKQNISNEESAFENISNLVNDLINAKYDAELKAVESLLSKEQTPPALRDVESTAKALENKIEVTRTKDGFVGDFLNDYELIGEGSEHTVYRSKDGSHVIRISEPYNDKSESTLNVRVRDAMLISEIIGDGSLEVIGYYESENGTKNPIYKQNFQEGTAISEQEAISYLQSIGAIEYGDKYNRGYLINYEGKWYKISDLTDNFFRNKNGEINAIDAAIQEISQKVISEAYHKAKADGSNPELVKAVEELLSNQKSKTPAALRDVESTSKVLEKEGLKPTLKNNGDGEMILQVDDIKGEGKRSVGVIGLKMVEVDGKKFLSIGMTSVREGYEGKGLATNMYRYLMENLPEGYDGILSPKETRWNNEQIPKIHEKLSKEYDKTELANGDIIFKNKAVEQSLPTQEVKAEQPTEPSTVSGKEVGSIGGDVKQQELDAAKVNKEAGIDIYAARQGVEVNGEKYTLSQIKENGNTNTFLIEDAKGNEVGKAQLSADGNYLENIRIDEKHRRKGLASKLYDFIELRKAIELEPSPNKQSKEAKALWDKRNLQKSVSKKANGGLLAKALNDAIRQTFGKQSLPTQEAKAEQPTVLGKEEGSGVGGGVKIKYGGKDKDLKGNPQKQWMKPTETSEQATNRLAEFVEASDFKGREQSAFIDKDGENTEVKLRNDNGKWNWYYPKSKKPFASFDTAKDAIKFIQEQPFWDNGELNKNGRNDAYFAKVKAEQIKTELENGNILEDINDGKISVQDAKAIIENAGLKVPKEIQSIHPQEVKAEQPQSIGLRIIPEVPEVITPVRQLGTGSNVYVDDAYYRLNDSRTPGKYLLNITNKGESMASYNIEFSDLKEAYFVAQAILQNMPGGFPPALMGKKHVDDIRSFYQELNNNPQEQSPSAQSLQQPGGDLFAGVQKSTFDTNVQELVDLLNDGTKDAYTIESVKPLADMLNISFPNGLSMVTVINPKTKQRLYQIFDDNGKVPSGASMNFTSSDAMIAREVVNLAKKEIEAVYNKYGIEMPVMVSDVFENPEKSSLGDLLNSTSFVYADIAAEIINREELVKKAGGVKKANPSLLNELSELNITSANLLSVTLMDLATSVQNMAIDLGYLNKTNIDQISGFFDAGGLDMFSDGRYMENVYNDLNLLEYAKNVFDEYFGPKPGANAPVETPPGGQPETQGQEGNTGQVLPGAQPNSGSGAEGTAAVLNLPGTLFGPTVDEIINQVSPEPEAPVQKSEEDALFDEFKNVFDEWKGAGTDGEPVMKSKDDTKLLAVGQRLIAMYVGKGVTSFPDIVADVEKKMGDNSPELLTALKKIYVSAKIGNSSLSTSFDDVDKFSYDDIKKPENGSDSTTIGQQGGTSGTAASGNAGNVLSTNGTGSGTIDGTTDSREILSRDIQGETGNSDIFAPVVGKQESNAIYQGYQGELFERTDSGIIDGRGSRIDGAKRTAPKRPGNAKTGGNNVTGNDTKHSYDKSVDKIPIEIGSIENIRETLPYLYPEQHEDVLKAEKRFFSEEHINDFDKANGKGYLFTNATGTGKTFTGLGIAKRFFNSGKKNILIVTPSQPKVSDWVEDGKNVGLDVVPLMNKKDAGDSVSITTFSNFSSNDALMDREFDLIIYDESHRLMDDKDGDASSATMTHYKLSNKDSFAAFQRITHNHPVWKKRNQLMIDYRSKQLTESQKIAIGKEIDDLDAKINELKPSLQKKADESVGKTKVVFLSATPFKVHFNLRYVNGYLFNWGDQVITNNRGSRVDAESRFYLTHFGSAYEWKRHKLQKRTKSNPDAIAMQEVAFSEKLMEDGVMSGRMIDSEMDYSREFPLVTGFNSETFNKAFSDIFNYKEDAQFEYLRNAATDVFSSYNYSTQLFESLKTSMSIPRIQKHLDLGRKVVVFHRRQQGNTSPPFESVLQRTFDKANEVINSDISTAEEKQRAIKAIEQVDLFRSKYSDLLIYESGLNYNSAVDQIKAEFGNKSVYINGNVSTKDKNNAIKNFNTDGSGVDIIVIQELSGKEGISLHDKTGKHQRVLISLSPPVSSTTGLQIEGRVYRLGQKTNAIFEYPLLGLDIEIAYFGNNINKRLSTTENLAMGNVARDLIRSFSEGVLFNSSPSDPSESQGFGGKEYDKKSGNSISLFEKAKLIYNTNQKQSGRRDQRDGVDYYATPEPVGQKMVEFADILMNESVLEPSAGHGAIAMWFDLANTVTAIEPSFNLYSKLTARSGGGVKKMINGTFEDLNIINKYDAIVMNPPFGQAGSTAMKHVEKAFVHLRDKGRIVALIPRGATDKKLENFLYGTNEKGKLNNPDAILVAEILLPSVTFEQAGTSVSTRIVVIDKGNESNQPTKTYDFSYVKNIDELFSKIENASIPPRDITEEKRNASINEDADSNADALNQEPAEEKYLSPVEQYENTRTRQMQPIVRMPGFVGKEIYTKLNSLAKTKGGYYSKYAKGFLFGDQQKANEFYNEGESPAVLKSIIGPKSVFYTDKKYTDLSNAKEMLANGENLAKIKIFTGWEKGLDDKWRYEITDPVFKSDEAVFANLTSAIDGTDVETTVGELFNDHELFRYYPDLKNSKVLFTRSMSGAVMSYVPGKNMFEVNANMFLNVLLAGKNLSGLNKAFIHEMTHYVQQKEGFARGGSERMFSDIPAGKADAIAKMNEIDQRLKSKTHTLDSEFIRDVNTMFLIEKLLELPEWLADNRQRYLALAGEMEANSVADRFGWSSLKRRASFLVPKKPAIITGTVDGPMNSEVEVDKASVLEQAKTRIIKALLMDTNADAATSGLFNVFESDLTDQEKQVFVDDYNKNFTDQADAYNYDVSKYAFSLWGKFVNDPESASGPIKSLLQRFSQWMVDLYDSFTNSKNQTIKLQVSPEVREVFENIIANGNNIKRFQESEPANADGVNQRIFARKAIWAKGTDNAGQSRPGYAARGEDKIPVTGIQIPAESAGYQKGGGRKNASRPVRFRSANGAWYKWDSGAGRWRTSIADDAGNFTDKNFLSDKRNADIEQEFVNSRITSQNVLQNEDVIFNGGRNVLRNMPGAAFITPRNINSIDLPNKLYQLLSSVNLADVKVMAYDNSADYKEAVRRAKANYVSPQRSLSEGELKAIGEINLNKIRVSGVVGNTLRKYGYIDIAGFQIESASDVGEIHKLANNPDVPKTKLVFYDDQGNISSMHLLAIGSMHYNSQLQKIVSQNADKKYAVIHESNSISENPSLATHESIVKMDPNYMGMVSVNAAGEVDNAAGIDYQSVKEMGSKDFVAYLSGNAISDFRYENTPDKTVPYVHSVTDGKEAVVESNYVPSPTNYTGAQNVMFRDNATATFAGGMVHINGSGFDVYDVEQAVLRAVSNIAPDKFTKELIENLRKSDYISRKYPFVDRFDETELSPEKFTDDGDQGAVTPPAPEIVAKYQNAQKFYGKDKVVILADGTRVRGKYVLVDAYDVATSHDENTFSDTPGFPTYNGKNSNDRNYKDDVSSQASVISASNKFDERSIDMPPIFSKDGIVLSGNNRTMSARLASVKNTNILYLAAMPEFLAEKGISGDVSGMRAPVVGIELYEDVPYTTGVFARFNKTHEKSKTTEDTLQSVKSFINDRLAADLAERLANYGNLSEFFERDSLWIVQKMISEGMIDKHRVTEFADIDKAGGYSLKDSGKTLVRSVLLGSILDTDLIEMIREEGLKDIFNKVGSASKLFIENTNAPQEYSITKDLNDAIRLLIQFKKNKGMNAISNIVKSTSIFDIDLKEDFSAEAILMAIYLDGPETQLKEFVQTVNTAVSGSTGASLFDALEERLSKSDIYNRYVDQKIAKLETIVAASSSKEAKGKASDDIALLRDLQKIGFGGGVGYKAAMSGGVLKSKIGKDNLSLLNSLYSDVLLGKDTELATAFNAAVRRTLDSFGYSAVTNYAMKAGIKDLYGVYLGKSIDMSGLSDQVLDNISNMAKSGLLDMSPMELYENFREKFVNYGITPGDLSRALDIPIQDALSDTFTSDFIAELGLPETVENPFDYYRGMGISDNAANYAAEIYKLLPDSYNKTATALAIVADIKNYPTKLEVVNYAPVSVELPENAPEIAMNSYMAGDFTLLPSEVFSFVRDVILASGGANFPLPYIYDAIGAKDGVWASGYDQGDVIIDEEGNEHTVVGLHHDLVVTTNNELVEPVGRVDRLDPVAASIQEITGIPVILMPGEAFSSKYGKYGATALTFIDPVNQRIVANSDAVTQKELIHEAAHVAVMKRFLDNKDQLPVFHRAIGAILKNGTDQEKALAVKVQQWVDQYTAFDAADAKMPLDLLKAHEFFAELVALLAENKAQISKPTEMSIIEAIKSILAKIFGIDVDFNEINDVIDFLNGLANDFVVGKVEDAGRKANADNGVFKSVLKSKDNNIFGNNGTQVKIYTYDNRGVNVYMEAKVVSQGRDDNGDRTVQLMNSAGEIESYLYDQFSSLTRGGQKYIVISGYVQNINEKYHTPAQIRKLDKIVDALSKDPSVNIHELYTTYKKDFAKNGLTMQDVRAKLENNRSEERGEAVKDFYNDEEVSDYIKRRLLFMDKNIIGDILANAAKFKKTGITNEEIKAYIDNLLFDATSTEELYAIFDNLKARKLEFVNDGFFFKVYGMAVIEIGRRVRAMEDGTFGFVPSRLVEILMEEQNVASAGSGALQSVQKNKEDDIYSTDELVRVTAYMNLMNTEELKNFNQDGASLYDIIQEMKEEVSFNDEEIDSMTDNDDITDILKRFFDQDKVDQDFVRSIINDFASDTDEPVLKSVIGNDVHKEIIRKVFAKFGDDKFAVMANYRAIIEGRFPGVDFDKYLEDNPFVTQLLAKEYAVLSIRAFKKSFSSNLDPAVAAVLGSVYKKKISSDDADLAKDPVAKLEELFSKKDVTISALQEMVLKIDDKIAAGGNFETLSNYKTSIQETIESLRTETGTFTGATENQFLNAVTFGIKKLDKGTLESMGYKIPEDAKPSDYAAIVMKHLVRQSAKQLNVSIESMARLFVTKMGLTEPQATELANAIHEHYLKNVMENKKAIVEQKLQKKVADTKKRSSLMERMIDLMLIGDISESAFADAFAEKFNLKRFDTDDLDYVNSLLDVWNDPSANPRDRQNAYRLIKRKIGESSESSVSAILANLKSLFFTNLLSGFNTAITSFISSFGANMALDAVMTMQLAKRGMYGKYKDYKSSNRDLFGFNPYELAYSMISGKNKSEIINSAAIGAALDAMLYGVGNISTSDIPDESFSTFDVIVNEYTSKVAKAFGRESRVAGISQSKSKGEKILHAVVAMYLGVPVMFVRMLGAMDVMMNTSSYEKAAFLEAIDAAHAEVGDTKSDEFFRVLYEKMGNPSIPPDIDTTGWSKLDIATYKKRQVLATRNESIRNIATQRVLTGMVINSNVRGLFTGLTSMLLTGPKVIASKSQDPYTKILAQIIDTFLVVMFFPIVKTVLNTIYLGYTYSPLVVPVNKLLKASTGIDKIGYDISSGRLLLNGLTLNEIKGSSKNSLASVLFNKNSAGRKLLAENVSSRADIEAMFITSITGTLLAALLLFYFFDTEDDDEGIKLVKNKEAWENIKVFANGVGMDINYDDPKTAKKKGYTGDVYIDNKRKYGNEFKDNSVLINGFHFRWNEMPIGPSVGFIGMLGDKLDVGERMDLGDALKYGVLGGMQYHYGEGFAIGLNQLKTIIEAAGAKSEKEIERANTKLAKMSGQSLSSKFVPALYRQSTSAYRGLTKGAAVRTKGDSFYDTMEKAFLKDIPFVDKQASVDIVGNKFPHDFDTYFVPDKFENYISDMVAQDNRSAGSKYLDRKKTAINLSPLYDYRGKAMRVGNDYKIPDSAKDDLNTLWSNLFNDILSENVSELIGMTNEEAQAYIEEMAASIRTMNEYVELREKLKVEKTDEEKAESKKGKKKANDAFSFPEDSLFKKADENLFKQK